MQKEISGQAGETGPKKSFDTTDRDRMRSALLRYMQEHRIGVPTLQARIAQASSRSTDLIPLKTLQRFLAHSHRTNDAFLIPVHQFSSTLPVRDENAVFAQALGGFFRGAMPEAAARETGARLTGSFAVLAEQRPDKPALLESKDRFTLLQGTMSVCTGAEPGMVHVREEVLVGDDGKAGDPESGFRHRYEGIALDLDTPIIVMLRNALTGFPKSYWLYRDRVRNLYGFVSSRRLNEPEKVSFLLRQPKSVVLEPRTEETQ